MQKQITRKNHFLPVLIFSFFFLIYLASSGAHTDPSDGVSYLLMAENFALNGSPSINYQTNISTAEELGFNLDWYILLWSYYNESNEKYEALPIEFKQNVTKVEYARIYAEDVKKGNFFGPGYLVLPTIAAPLYLIAKSFDLSPIHFVPLFLNSIILAVSCVVIFFLGKEIFKSQRIGFVLSLIFGVTSFIWPYITTMFARPVAILFFMLAIYFILHQKNKQPNYYSFFAGVCIGLSALSHPIFYYLLPGIIFFGFFELRKNKKNLVMFVLAILILFSIQGLLNELRFGDPFNLGFGLVQEEKEMQRTFTGVYGLLFSPGLSIFLYIPVALLLPFGIYYLYKKNKSLVFLFLYVILVTYYILATDPDWYKNPQWGSHRYLLPLIPMIVLSIGSLISKFSDSIRWRCGIISLSIVGFFVNLFGNLVWIQYAHAYGWSPEGLWKVQDTAEVFTWNPYYSPVVQNIKVLSADWIASLPLHVNADSYFRIGLNGCSYDIYLFCEYGILPMMLLGIGITVLGFIILRMLKSDKKKLIFTEAQNDD